MADLKYADRVAESTVSTGTGDINLAGAIDTDHATFGSQFADGDLMPVSVFGGGKWMTFTGRYNSGANSVTRITFRRSSTGSNLSLSGTMTVMCGWGADDAAAMVRSDIAQSLTSTQQNQAQKNAGIPAIMRSYLAGFNVSTAASAALFIAAGVATDSTNADTITLSAFSKTSAAWALGSGLGSLDVGTVEPNKFYHVFPIKRVDTGVCDAVISLAPGASSAVTITSASPGVISWPAHGLQVNAPVVFSTTVSLPTGLISGTQYFVKTVPGADSFTVSATQGGAAINTSSAGSGTHTAASNPILPTNYTLSRRIRSLLTDGSSNWVGDVQIGDDILWKAPPVDVNVSNLSTSRSLYALTVPTGIPIKATCYGNAFNTTACVMWVGSPFVPDAVPSLTATPGAFMYTGIGATSGTTLPYGTLNVQPDTAGRIAARSDQANTGFRVYTQGYTDRRGKDN